MGGGASSRKGKGKADAASKQADTASSPADEKKMEREAASKLSPALRRRRRVLLGYMAPRKFESVEPKDQFGADIEEDELPFSRFEDLAHCNQFRNRVDAVQHHSDGGYLRENSVEVLELGVEKDSFLAKRLLKVVQVQAGKRMPGRVTCYELLALHSVIRWGTVNELLELLFCVFDTDDDDFLSVQDLTSGIDIFLELQEATDGLQGADQEDFKKMGPKGRRRQARKLAVAAIKDYTGVTDSDAEEVPTAAASSSAQATAGVARGKAGSSDDDDDRSSHGSYETAHLSALSTTPNTAPGEEAQASKKPPRKRRGRSLCGGKPPADDDSSETGEGSQPAKTRDGGSNKPPRKRGGLCGGGGAGRRRRKSLTYQQWLHWLQESGMLPAEFAAAIGVADGIGSERLSEGKKEPRRGSKGSRTSSGQGSSLGAAGVTQPMLANAASRPMAQPQLGGGLPPGGRGGVEVEGNAGDSDASSSRSSSPGATRQMREPLLA